MPRKTTPKPPEDSGRVVEFATFKGGHDVPAFYANSTQIFMSQLDITLIIGQSGFGPDGKAEMWEVARLNLSPQHAKALAEVLTKRVADYERQFGAIGGQPPSEKPQPS